MKTNCRNGINNTYYNWDGSFASLINTSSTAGTAYDIWDTIDDRYGFSPNTVTGWSSDTVCDSSVWADVTTANGGGATTTCAADSANCQYKDQISNLVVTKRVSASSTWSAAVNTCNDSVYGGFAAGMWRLPTQKELMTLYEHGISAVAGADFITLANMNYFYWSSSNYSLNAANAWGVSLGNGFTPGNSSKAGTYNVVCVR